MIGATTIPSPQKPIALPRSWGGKASSSTACESGCMTPPVKPWMTRKTIRIGRVGASPQSEEARVKAPTDASRRRFLPKKLASQPVIGRMTALAVR